MNARVTKPKPGDAQPVVVPMQEAPRVEAPKLAAVPPEAPPAPAPKKRNVRRLVLMIVVPLALAVAGGYFCLTGGRYRRYRQRLCAAGQGVAVGRRRRPHRRRLGA